MTSTAASYDVGHATCAFTCISCNGYTSYSVLPSSWDSPYPDSVQLSGIGHFSTGTQYDLTAGSTWSSNNTSVATVGNGSSAGLVSPIALGSASMLAQSPDVALAGRACGSPPNCADLDGILPGQATGNVTPKVIFGPLTAVTVGGTVSVQVSFTVGAASPKPITLSIATTSGTGSAIFSTGGTTTTITNAPTTVFIKGVTASSTPNNLLLNATVSTGDGPQPDATNPQSFSVLSVAIPVNFQTYSVNKLPDGTLVFAYTWQSSSGNLQDIAACLVGETVFYPGTDKTYTWPLPMVSGTQNPFLRYFNGNNPSGLDAQTAGLGDYNYPPTSYQLPYSPGSDFPATQALQWSCDYYNDGSYNLFVPKLTILRQVSLDQTSEKWVYTITKSGYSNSAVLPNQ